MANGIDWFRWHHGSVTDPKFALIARKAGARLGDVLAVWAYVLEAASAATERGQFGPIDAEAVDCLLDMEEGATAAILAAMDIRGLTADGAVSNWEKRQPRREDDTAAERKRRQRDREHELAVTAAMSRNVTQGHAPVTQRHDREEESIEEEIRLSARKEREQADADARARLEAEGFKPTAAGAVCKAMRQAGLMSSNPGDPRLLALLAQGATEAEFVGIAAEAYAGGKGFAWVLKVLESRRAEAASINLAPAVQAVDVGRIAVEKTANDLAALDAHAALAQTPEAHAARRAAMARVRPQQEAA